jgi:hypothetical protein
LGPGRSTVGQLLRLALAAYDQMIGLDLEDLAVIIIGAILRLRAEHRIRRLRNIYDCRILIHDVRVWVPKLG